MIEPGKVFITFEAGATHTGYESAIRLAEQAKEVGADAIKFQMVDPDRLYADKTTPLTYGVHGGEEVTEPVYDILKQRVLEKSEWRSLRLHCHKLKLRFFCTATQTEEVDFLAEIGCQSVKVSSGDLNQKWLVKYMAESRPSIQIDTGNSTLGEIETAVDWITETGNEDIIIHHCPSGYPAHRDGINLNIITTLKQMFPYPIAFSDHTPGWDMDIAAVALGVSMVEKTITEDRTIRGPEHMFSLEGPDEMLGFVNAIRTVEAAMGTTRRLMTDDEREKRKAGRRSYYPEWDGYMRPEIKGNWQDGGWSRLSKCEFDKWLEKQ
ncbi:MAG TPA: N-acetylneuraminate synthase [bacterium]|nr:N-acetylneuraminate synthase [bacterium]